MRPLPVTLLLTAITLLAGCSLLPVNAPTPEYANATAVYQTISAELTASALPPQKTSHPDVPSADGTPLPVPSATSTAPGALTSLPPSPTRPCDLAAPGKPGIDISVPDNSPMLPGQSFSKTWRLVNNGSCTWTREYSAVWFSGEKMTRNLSLPLNSVVQPGQSVDITVDFVAPSEPGVYQSNWMMKTENGKVFGLGPAGSGPFYVRIEVVVARTSTPTPLPTFTPAPTLAVVARGTLTLPLLKNLDLDSGKLLTDLTADLDLQGKPEVLALAPVNGSVIALMGAAPPTLQECKAAALRSDAISLKPEMTSSYICYRTSKALPGIALLKAINFKEAELTLEFTTWAVP